MPLAACSEAVRLFGLRVCGAVRMQIHRDVVALLSICTLKVAKTKKSPTWRLGVPHRKSDLQGEHADSKRKRWRASKCWRSCR